jgi:uncharacterized protein YbjT (DUF2867 family)
LRGVKTVIHLAAAIRDQGPATVQEINGLATSRLLRAAERTGVERFAFFSALNASEFQRTRFFRSKALAEEAVERSPLDSTVFAPSIVYDRDDPWVTIQRRFALLPAVPISGTGDAAYQPIWAHDVAECVVAGLADGEGSARYELAGPETLTYEEIARLIARASGHERTLLHIPLSFVRAGLNGIQRVFGDTAFATWEEAELMEVPMTSPRGSADVEALGVTPRRMADVLTA